MYLDIYVAPFVTVCHVLFSRCCCCPFKICSATPAMALYFKDNAYLREAAKVLNILYVYDRSYEPYLINWLFPLQLAFQDGNSEGMWKTNQK